jgi:5-methylcytosine-specific restriction endonuclease McrA
MYGKGNVNPHADGRRSVPRPKGWHRIRARILRRDRGTCYVCGSPATHVDHIIPASRGGSDDDTNLAAMCVTCHNRKTAQEANALHPKRQSRRREPEAHPGDIPQRPGGTDE